MMEKKKNLTGFTSLELTRNYIRILGGAKNTPDIKRRYKKDEVKKRYKAIYTNNRKYS